MHVDSTCVGFLKDPQAKGSVKKRQNNVLTEFPTHFVACLVAWTSNHFVKSHLKCLSLKARILIGGVHKGAQCEQLHIFPAHLSRIESLLQYFWHLFNKCTEPKKDYNGVRVKPNCMTKEFTSSSSNSTFSLIYDMEKVHGVTSICKSCPPLQINSHIQNFSEKNCGQQIRPITSFWGWLADMCLPDCPSTAQLYCILSCLFMSFGV
jgi:hypothetical protein